MADPTDLRSWRASAFLRFRRSAGASDQGEFTLHQGGATAPLKLQRAFRQSDGRCELPILHTAGGLVGGDQLVLEAELEAGSRVLLTSVAAQKVYGTVGRCRQSPQGRWAEQRLRFRLETGADLEWFPQELVLYRDGLFRQRTRVELAAGASFLGVEVVRLGRSAAGESLGRGRWQGEMEILRIDGQPWPPQRWELVDRLELGGESLRSPHGMAREPVLGTLIWAAPTLLSAAQLNQLLADCRRARADLEGTMACGALEQGILARYRGSSAQAARFWFTRIWARIRAVRGLDAPRRPRVWPFQEAPLT